MQTNYRYPRILYLKQRISTHIWGGGGISSVYHSRLTQRVRTQKLITKLNKYRWGEALLPLVEQSHNQMKLKEQGTRTDIRAQVRESDKG